MSGNDPAEYAIRLGLWLAAREEHRDSGGGTTLIRREPLDRSSSAYTIAESDVAAAVARAAELEAENARLRDDSSERALAERNEQLRDERDTARAEVARAWEDLTAAREERDRLAAENTQLRADLEAALMRLNLLALPVSAEGLRALLTVIEQQPAPELPDRQAKLLAGIQREGGDWSPLRAREEMVRCGYAVTSERAHQIMKALAERGYLEQVRPRAYTYRLKAGRPHQCDSHAHPDFVEDHKIRCELPESHVWHRNGERTWTP